MKIAIVGPSPIPFAVGGMENMIGGLYEQINHNTDHQAELIKLPTKEHGFWDLIESYYRFYKLDVSHFDAIIVSKYPAWMVQHNNKIFYVAHRLRGLYDTYHYMNQPTEVKRGNTKIDQILDYIDTFPHPDSLDTFFNLLFTLKDTASANETPYFEFPGPFIRKLVHYMDDYAFGETDLENYFSISRTVKDREDYFPASSHVEVVYLPPAQISNSTGLYKHIFMVSRLDKPKRIDMLIKAMKYVKSEIQLYIAGTGPEKEKLEKLAGKDKRIHFLGFVSDEEVDSYYANSLVIPYFPQEEDYGLITIEAMMHRKPVITTVDAGGPTEFVHNYQTGFVTECDAKAIAEKIDYMVQHEEKAMEMGENAFRVVNSITWQTVLDTILKEATERYKPRKKITVTSTFGIYPPLGGGQSRTYNIFREVGKWADVEVVSYTDCNQPSFNDMIAKGVREIRTPRSLAHQELLWKMERKAQAPMTDIGELTLGGQTAQYVKCLSASIEKSDLVIFSHPYLYPLAKKYLCGKPFIYEAQDVEYIIKKGILPESRVKQELIDLIFKVEKECCDNAEIILTCSEEDRKKICEVYHIPREKIIVVPNGVNTKEIQFTSVQQRRQNKMKLGLNEEKIGVFMGSWHGPNLEACKVLFQIAERCPDAKFMLMGSQCGYFKDKALPENVALMGLVSEETKAAVFRTVDFALNPMYSGSGTNLKMFDYMASGLPIITTEFGARGIEKKDSFIIANTVDEFVEAVNGFSLEQEAQQVVQARAYAEDTFDWKVIVSNFQKFCNTHFL